jgi:hypothetical protein
LTNFPDDGETPLVLGAVPLIGFEVTPEAKASNEKTGAIMLLIQTAVDRITELLNSNRPFAFVPAESRGRAKEIAGAARDAGFGVAVIEDRSRGLLVMVIGDQGHSADLRHFVRPFGAEIATTRHPGIEKAYCAAGWFTRMAQAQGTDVGRGW